MGDPVAAAVAAPKKAFAFATHNLLAFAVLAAVVLLAVVFYDSRKPGDLRAKVYKLPVIGPRITNQQAA